MLADAIVPCKACGAAEGAPCVGEEGELEPRQVHFARRVKRLLLTAKHPERRTELESEAVAMLIAHLQES